MKSKRLTLIFALLVFTVPVMAILNGQGLDRILRDVKSELRNDWQLRQNEQDRLQQSYEDQHSRMLDIIKDCNELSMSLYLQKKEYTFDLSYALQRVSQEYKDFNKSRTPYDIIDMYEEYDFLENLLCQGVERWILPSDDPSIKEDVSYTMSLSGCGWDGEITSDVYYVDFIWHQGRVQFTYSDIPIIEDE
ncbi:MAG: hypothetical protein K5843_07985 [Bacteroidales bacterium]|nr:hypothetical protein [Bacteroidales bacterium]